jgi:hypothetical protein
LQKWYGDSPAISIECGGLGKASPFRNLSLSQPIFPGNHSLRAGLPGSACPAMVSIINHGEDNDTILDSG